MFDENIIETFIKIISNDYHKLIRFKNALPNILNQIMYGFVKNHLISIKVSTTCGSYHKTNYILFYEKLYYIILFFIETFI